MLAGHWEDITVTAPASGGTEDPQTGEVLIGALTTTHTPSVLWITTPKRELKFDMESGRVIGQIRGGEAQLLYEARGRRGDIDWNTLLVPGVTVTREGLIWVPYAISEWPMGGIKYQLVSLRLQEGAN